MAFKTLSRTTAIVAACGLLAACVAPHQAEYDRARAACAVEATQSSCQAAYQLGNLVAAEKAEQAAAADAVAASMLAVSAGLNAAAAARQPRYVPVVVCAWPYC